jgi:Bacterial Ig domain/Right handed beta helix region
MKLTKIATRLCAAATVLLVACSGGGGETSTPLEASQTDAQAAELRLKPLAAAVEEVWPPAIQDLTSTSACSTAMTAVAGGTTYNVGPGKAYAELTTVPWMSLKAGDVVNVFYRATPYRTKFLLRVQGTATAPFVLNGVTDASCNRPEINGADAVTADDVKSTKALYAFGDGFQTVSLIEIHRAKADPSETYRPTHIAIKNLKLAGANVQNTFLNEVNVKEHYALDAAAIHALSVDHLTIENCEITANGEGIFTNSRNYSPVDFTSNIIIRRNKIYGNGVGAGEKEHDLYIQSRRVLYEGNRFGPQAPGINPDRGSTVKDRSSGMVMRYNHIISAARAIDMVHPEADAGGTTFADPLHKDSWVYGNLIETDETKFKESGGVPIHWGFDKGVYQVARKKLNFYNNTFVSSHSDGGGKSFVFQTHEEAPLPNNSIIVEAQSNVFTERGANDFIFAADTAHVKLLGSNFLPFQYHGIWRADPQKNRNSVLEVGSGSIVGTVRGAAGDKLDANYRPTAASTMLIDKGTITPPGVQLAGIAVANLNVTHQYTEGGWKRRAVSGAAPDLGAFEYDGASPPPPPANLPPTVTLTSPTNNASYPFPATVTLSARASDADGIAKLEFFNATTGQSLGSEAKDAISFSLPWPRGTYTVKVVATDKKGASSTATAIIKVGVTTTPPPPTGTWVTLANEFDAFTVIGSKVVRFGADTRWLEKTVTGTNTCSRELFGGDPADGVAKLCQLKTQ